MAFFTAALATGLAAINGCGDDDDAIPAPDAGSEAGDAGGDAGAVTDARPEATTETGVGDGARDGGRTLDGGACGGDPVSLTAATPQFAWKDAPTALTLTGTGFVATPKVYLRAAGGAITQVQHVAYVSSTSISAVIPAGTFTAGTYEIAVVNSNTCAGTLSAVLRIVDDAPPGILDVSPATGTTQIDVPVTVKGCNFQPDAQVSVVDSTGKVTAMASTAPACGAPSAACGGAPECTIEATIETKTKTLLVGAYLVRVTNVARATWGDFATFVVTNPAGNLGTWVDSPALVTGRRSLGVVAGRVNTASRFVYAIGGEDAAGGPLDSIEVGPLDVFGQLGSWFVQKNRLNRPRSGAAVARHGSWIYVIGGTASANGTGGQSPTGAPLASIERAKILDPASAPKPKAPQVSATGGTLAKGTWYYRVSAIGGDAEDPGGETLASDEIVASLDASGTVTIAWEPVAGATAYRIYRSTAADAVADSEVYLATVTTPSDGGTGTSFVDDGSLTPDGGAAGTGGFLRPGSTGRFIEVANAIGGGGVGKLNAAATVAPDPGGAAYLYVTGGWGRCLGSSAAAALLDCVEVAKINADGSLGAFANGGKLEWKRMRHGVQTMTKENGVGFEQAGSPNAAFLLVGGGNGAQASGFVNVEQSLVGAGGVNAAFSTPDLSAVFPGERDGTQLLVANGFAYVFFGGSKAGQGVNYAATAEQSTQATLTGTGASLALNFASWNNAGANLGGEAKTGRHGMTTESAYFYMVGGTTNDQDALATVRRILH